jgi:hypothetical protein
VLLAFSAEATAALAGAALGGGIALVAEFGLHFLRRRLDRRAAAQVIYAELTTNYAAANVSLELGSWPTSSGAAELTAWQTHGVKLARGRGLTELADVASAYSRLDDFVFLGKAGALSHDDDYADQLAEIRLGLYVVGRMAGWTDAELRGRKILDDDVLAVRAERERLRRAAKT